MKNGLLDYWMLGLLARGEPRDDVTNPTNRQSTNPPIRQSISPLIH
jgi:hypothetical protein